MIHVACALLCMTREMVELLLLAVMTTLPMVMSGLYLAQEVLLRLPCGMSSSASSGHI